MIGLASYGPIPTGLGSESIRLWKERKRTNITRWLIEPHPDHGVGTDKEETTETKQDVFIRESRYEWDTVYRFLDGLRTVVFIERPVPNNLVEICYKRNIATVCLVNPEWLPNTTKWISKCTRFVARNNFGYQHLIDLKIPVDKQTMVRLPLPPDEIEFEERKGINKILFTNGTGGVYNRKGWDEIRQVLQSQPKLIEVSSLKELEDVPEGVTVRPKVDSPKNLYKGYDMVVVPSKFGSIELTILEAMAAGAIVLTTNKPPMSEPIQDAYGLTAGMHLIDTQPSIPVNIWNRTWRSYPCEPKSILNHIHKWSTLPYYVVQSESKQARQYIESYHHNLAWEGLRWALEM